MNIKTAFREAVETYPERERKVALATFVNRYSQGWHISDYRCVGRDADVIKMFLEGCGFGSADLEDVVSALDPDAHQLRWPNPAKIKELASELQRMLPTESHRVRLYTAQLDRTEDPAPGLADPAPTDGGPRVWDPLSLFQSTSELAKRLAAEGTPADPDAILWAKEWLGKPERERTIMAPLWVLERVMPGSLGLFMVVNRSSTGSTASIPFSFGRYVRRDEPLSPPFPTLTAMPIANIWGTDSTHASTPLDGYVAVTADDLAETEPDGPGTAESTARDVWMHVESAYTKPGRINSIETMSLMTRPQLLWEYVCRIFEHTYRRRAVLIPGQCMVHAGAKRTDECAYLVSALDRDVLKMARLEVRMAIMLANEEPAAGRKPCGADSVAPGERGLVLLPGDPRPSELCEPAKEHDEGRFDMVGTLALEWYMMTHMSTKASLKPSVTERIPGGNPEVVKRLRAWATGKEMSPEDAKLPDNVTVEYTFTNGYNAGTHLAYSILSEMRTTFDMTSFSAVSPADWKGSNKKLHGAPSPVVAVYSCVLGDGCPIPDLTTGAISPEEVTKVLNNIADPKVQLAVPDRPKDVMVVVETQIKAPASTSLRVLMASHSRVACLLNLFLWPFMVNEAKHPKYTLLCRNSCARTPRYVCDELKTLGGTPYYCLWADGTRPYAGLPDMNNDYDYDALTDNLTAESTKVRMMADSHGRLVLAFKVRALSPVECACRAAFRYYINAPLLCNESYQTSCDIKASKFVQLTPKSKDFKAVMDAHLACGCAGAVPGWTSVSSFTWNAFGEGVPVPPTASGYTASPALKGMTAGSVIGSLS